MKILSFAGSTSKNSINKSLAAFVARKISGAEITDLDLNQFSLPIFSVDIEKDPAAQGQAKAFLDKIAACDGIVLSLAEHNGSYAAAFKNLLDWSSRQNPKLFQNKPMLLMATSPGARGGMGVLTSAQTTFPFLGAQLCSTFSLPEYYKNFNAEKGIVSEELAKHLAVALASFTDAFAK